MFDHDYILKSLDDFLLSFNSQQPTANSQQPTANSQQPTVNSQQPTANSQQPFTKHGQLFKKEITGTISKAIVKGEEIKIILGDDSELYYLNDQNNPDFEIGAKVVAIARLNFKAFYLSREEYNLNKKIIPQTKGRLTRLSCSNNGPVLYLLEAVAMIDTPTSDEVKVKTHRGSNFVATYQNFRLECFGDRNTGLWRKTIGDDGVPVYRQYFEWPIMRHILEQAILDRLIDYNQAYSVYCRVINEAIRVKAVKREDARVWWKTLWELAGNEATPIPA